MRFTDDEYSLTALQFLWRSGHPGHRNTRWHSERWTTRYFGRINIARRDAATSALEYAVESAPDRSTFNYCYEPNNSDCYDIGVDARSESGLLYLHMNTRYVCCGSDVKLYVQDFVPQRVELSAADSGSGMKIYQEVMVEPSPRAPDCADFKENDRAAMDCKFLSEFIPDDTSVSAAQEAAWRNNLPDLVQSSSNYELIFFEDFNGTADLPESETCQNGMITVDTALWNYDLNPCLHVDIHGVPCGNVENGYFYFARSHTCTASMNSIGKFSYKYGYLEIKYTFDLSGYFQYINLPFTIWGGYFLNALLNKYGVELDSYEAVSRYNESEIDLFEYSQASRHEVAHDIINWLASSTTPGVYPRASTKDILFCGVLITDEMKRALRLTPDTGCNTGNVMPDKVTITKGLEWTPRGYRTFLKVDGVHDEMTLLPKENIDIIYMLPIDPSAETWEYAYREVLTYEGEDRDQFFELLDPNDPGSLLQQVGIAHTPLPLGMAAWGGQDSGLKEIRTKMRIDYIRIFQPQNHYSDMEPVFG